MKSGLKSIISVLDHKVVKGRMKRGIFDYFVSGDLAGPRLLAVRYSFA